LTLLLSTDDCARVIKMPEAIAILEQAYLALAQGEATFRPRSDMVVPTRPGEDYWLATMEGAIRPLGVAAIRLRSDYKQTQVRYGVPTVEKWAQRPGLYCGLAIIYSLHTAEPLAIIADGYLQVMRVAATSALAGKYLARPDSTVLGIIGASFQAHDHARAYAALFPLQQIKVYCRTPEGREQFAEEMSEELGVPVVAVSSSQEAVRGSDIVAACTDSKVPVLDGDDIEPGTYVSSIRYFAEIQPQNARTIDLHVVHPPTYGPQLRVGTQEELQHSPSANWNEGTPIPEGSIDLHDVVARSHPGRTSRDQRILFNNHSGMGIQFAALGKVVYERAKEMGIGRALPTEWFLQDIST
jgi:alanine dehydrogenase